MVKVKIKKTGEVKVVTNNIAHGLIESGLAEVYIAKSMSGYSDKAMKPARGKKSRGYKTK